MANITVYRQEDNQSFSVTVNCYSTVMEGTPDGVGEYYLRISTNYTFNGVSFPVYVVRDLTDVAPNQAPPAATFSDLIKGYLDYYINDFMLESSSSSSSFGFSESSNSLSSSSSSSTSSSSL